MDFLVSPPPGPGQPLYVLKLYLFVNSRGLPSFKKSPGHPQEGYVLPSPSALRLAPVSPLAYGVTLS